MEATLETTTFKGILYTVLGTLPASEALQKHLDLVSQSYLQGKGGALFLLQTFKDGTRRTISQKGNRVAYEYPKHDTPAHPHTHEKEAIPPHANGLD